MNNESGSFASVEERFTKTLDPILGRVLDHWFLVGAYDLPREDLTEMFVHTHGNEDALASGMPALTLTLGEAARKNDNPRGFFMITQEQQQPEKVVNLMQCYLQHSFEVLDRMVLVGIAGKSLMVACYGLPGIQAVFMLQDGLGHWFRSKREEEQVEGPLGDLPGIRFLQEQSLKNQGKYTPGRQIISRWRADDVDETEEEEDEL